ncbi:conserved Plasmodium protein, unknown function [Plasmodium malariae]|nr:conserved Plasmodium protein, unknown function [Plasmodium malariae]
MKHKEKEKTVILKGLNDNFFNAILVCMNEIIHYLNFVNFKRMMNKSNTKKKKNEELDETTYFVKSARNENNVYNNNIKDVISYNKKKKKINDTYINGESNNKNCENNIVNLGNKNINCNKENKNDFPTILSSNNIEEFGYEYIKDIIKNEEKKLYETDKMYINSNDEYSSHTSDSMSQ